MDINTSKSLLLNPQPYEKSILFIVGPTASGKSELAMQVAQKLDGEIICADSQTIRHDIDIITAKPLTSDQKLIRHHMLDIIDPYDKYTVAEFKQEAEKIISGIRKKGKLPIIVGGTGLYINALLYDYEFRKSDSDYTRDFLEQQTVDELQKIVTENKLPMPNNLQNPRHLIRAIETKGQQSERKNKISGAIVIGVDPGKEILNERIEKRIRAMVDSGLLDEVESVVQKYGLPDKNVDAIGFQIVLNNRIAQGEYNKDKLIEQLNIAHRQYAKRQRLWYKNNHDVKWFESSVMGLEYINNLLA